jgi:GNAT superfamily N-acetyltransferase
MDPIQIREYSEEDSREALALEASCVQGKTLALKYRRPFFHARSGVYAKHKILCARQNGRLAGITAWAEKDVTMHGRRIKAAYLYDLRVHPDARKKGVSIHLSRALFEDIGAGMDCIYTWVAGENERFIKPAQRLFGMNRLERFTYVVFPVFKRRRVTADWRVCSAGETHHIYMRRNRTLEFIPDFEERSLLGFVSGIRLVEPGSGACSMWSNEGLLEEQVVSIPKSYRLLRALTQPLRRWVDLPYIPKPGDTLRSRFLFDFSSAAGAEGAMDARNLISIVNNLALKENIQFLYILLQDNSPLLSVVRKLGFRTFSFPYCFLAKGPATPAPGEEIYVDIRDL